MVISPGAERFSLHTWPHDAEEGLASAFLRSLEHRLARRGTTMGATYHCGAHRR